MTRIQGKQISRIFSTADRRPLALLRVSTRSFGHCASFSNNSIILTRCKETAVVASSLADHLVVLSNFKLPSSVSFNFAHLWGKWAKELKSSWTVPKNVTISGSTSAAWRPTKFSDDYHSWGILPWDIFPRDVVVIKKYVWLLHMLKSSPKSFKACIISSS